jgi:hypothetical protein
MYLSFHAGQDCHCEVCHSVPTYSWSSTCLIMVFAIGQGLAAKGMLGKLKVDDLKKYLKANSLKLTGKKDELIQRITEHVEKSKS